MKLYGAEMKNTWVGKEQFVNLQEKIRQNSIVGFLLVNAGILLAASAGGWDITNHLLNKPESFFSPPHAALYSGVGLVIIGAILIYIGRSIIRGRKSRNTTHHTQRLKAVIQAVSASYSSSPPLSVKLVYLGVILLVSAGPFDFVWHSTFGLDGLLSPPHAVLTIGMTLCSIGSFLGILSTSKDMVYGTKSNGRDINAKKNNGYVTNNLTLSENSRIREIFTTRLYNKSLRPAFVIMGILPVWLTISGLIHMATLPFSDTPFFNFNPDPIVAIVIATICFPFLIAIILFSSSRLCGNESANLITGHKSVTSWKNNNKGIPFGMLSVTGLAFIVVNILTSILPNEYLIPTLPFYILNILPILAADILLSKGSLHNRNHNFSKQRENKMANYLAGAILGLAFFTLYFPLITHTYNEALPNPGPVWPSLTITIYFKMIDEVSVFIIAPAMIMGIFGVVVASRLLDRKERRKITTSELA
jgi:hypothetical protein